MVLELREVLLLLEVLALLELLELLGVLANAFSLYYLRHMHYSWFSCYI